MGLNVGSADVSLWGPYRSLWVSVGAVRMSLYGVPIGLYGGSADVSLWVPIGLYGGSADVSLWVPVGSPWVSMRAVRMSLYGSL